MNVLIVFFSATGNTKYGTILIKKGIESMQGNTCDMAETREYTPELAGRYDLIGFASPVFAYKPSLVMLEFIKRLPDAKGKACFTFFTHAGVVGNSHWMLAKMLGKKGYKVIARKDILSQGSWTTIREAGKLEYEDEPSKETQKSVIEFGRGLAAAYSGFVDGSLKPPAPVFKMNIYQVIRYKGLPDRIKTHV